MRRQHRIFYIDHLRVYLQVARDLKRVQTVTVHSHGKCFKALRKYPGVEGGHRGSGVTRKKLHLLDQFFCSKNRTTEHTSLAIDEFCRRMGYNMSAPFSGVLQVRSSETIVDIQNYI